MQLAATRRHRAGVDNLTRAAGRPWRVGMAPTVSGIFPQTPNEETRIMETDETCEGYKNYPTFTVAVDIANERGKHDYWHNLAAEYLAVAVPAAPFTAREVAGVRLCETLRAHHEEILQPVADNGIGASLLGYALGCVDWWEIACELIDTVAENAETYGVTL